jgi:hypothetical protein
VTRAITIWRKERIVYVTIDERCCRLGAVQGRLVWLLVDAAGHRFPWLPGNQLLERAGSRAVRPKDVFRRRRELRTLIRSNGNGDYTLAPGQRVDPDTYEVDRDWLTRQNA